MKTASRVTTLPLKIAPERSLKKITGSQFDLAYRAQKY